jgi:hypothetical protein
MRYTIAHCAKSAGELIATLCRIGSPPICRTRIHAALGNLGITR